MPPQQPTPPDSLSRRPTGEITEVRRAQALACQSVLTLPGDAAKLAAQKIEMDAREAVMALDPESATEGEMRCALAAWRHACRVFSSMSSFVSDTNRRLEEAQKNASKQ
jgi:hypothetical protein